MSLVSINDQAEGLDISMDASDWDCDGDLLLWQRACSRRLLRCAAQLQTWRYATALLRHCTHHQCPDDNCNLHIRMR